MYATSESEELTTSYKYNDFMDLMSKKTTEWRTPLPPKKTIFDSLFKKNDSEIDKQIIEAQKKKIDELVKLLPEDVLKDSGLIPDTSE